MSTPFTLTFAPSIKDDIVNNKGENSMNSSTFCSRRAPFTAMDGTVFESRQAGPALKLHYYLDGSWRRLPSGRPAEVNEYAVSAEFERGIWRISFIADDPAEATAPVLYRLLAEEHLPRHECDLLNISAITRADCGFSTGSLTAYAFSTGPVRLVSGTCRTELKFHDASEYHYVTWDPFAGRDEIIIGGLTSSGQAFRRCFNTVNRRACEMPHPADRNTGQAPGGIELAPFLFDYRKTPECRYMKDTGRKAFINIPCRGNSVICRRDGHRTYTYNCSEDNCRNFDPGPA